MNLRWHATNEYPPLYPPRFLTAQDSLLWRLPEHLVEDIIDLILFLTNHHPATLGTCQLYPLMTMVSCFRAGILPFFRVLGTRQHVLVSLGTSRFSRGTHPGFPGFPLEGTVVVG